MNVDGASKILSMSVSHDASCLEGRGINSIHS